MSRFILPFQRTEDLNSHPLDGAKLYFFDTGTSTPRDTYSDVALATPNTNPIIADSQGQFGAIFLSGTYRVRLDDKNDVTQPDYPVDNVTANITTAQIPDSAVTPVKLDSTLEYTFNSIITKGPWITDVRAYMDGLSGRPTLAAWEANPTTVDSILSIKAAVSAREALGGGPVYLKSDKTFAVSSAVTLGAGGNETFLVSDSKNGATIKALSAFTGGVVIIGQGGLKSVSLTGFDKATSGHVGITVGTASIINPLVRIEDVLNNGGFYDFIKTIYEYDRAIFNRITSEVELGHAVMDMQTGGSYALAANPVFSSLSFRNPDITPAVGDVKKYGILLKRSEGAKISGAISNFDRGVFLNAENKTPDLANLVCLDLRSTVSNDLWQSAWAATTNYSVNDYRKPTAANANGHFYIVTADAGSSGGSEPTWPTGHNATVVDGGITWTEVGESIGISVGSEQQVQIGPGVRCEDAIVALKNESNANIKVSSSRFVGESTAILNDSGTNSEMQMDNCLVAGDFHISKGAGTMRFLGQNNLITGDTIGDVLDHEGHSWSNGVHTFLQAIGPDFSGWTPLAGMTTQVLDRYEEGVWTPTVTDVANTANAAITTSFYTIIGNRCFCGIKGTVDITADDTNTYFKFTVPKNMHSGTLSDIGGSIILTTNNGDYVACGVLSNTGANTTEAILVVPKKGIATSGDSGTGRPFAGNFSYLIA